MRKLPPAACRHPCTCPVEQQRQQSPHILLSAELHFEFFPTSSQNGSTRDCSVRISFGAHLRVPVPIHWPEPRREWSAPWCLKERQRGHPLCFKNQGETGDGRFLPEVCLDCRLSLSLTSHPSM